MVNRRQFLTGSALTLAASALEIRGYPADARVAHPLRLAPYHFQARNASVEEAIRTCGSQLLFFYAWQKAAGMGQLPGHGPADFKPWLVALAEEKYRGHVNPFMHGHVESKIMDAAMAKSRDCLRGLAPAV